MADSIIQYGKGITRAPSDFMSSDGELEECVNLEVKNGELRAMEMPVKINLALNDGEVLTYVHTTESGLHCYLTITSKKLSQSTTIYVLGALRKVDDTFVRMSIEYEFTEKPKNIVGLGNIILVYYSEKVLYFIYKNGDYTYLGDKLPELDIAFSLTGSVRYKTYTLEDIGYTIDINGNLFPEFPADDTSDAQQLLGYVKDFINNEAMGNGYFMYPFLIRWAYRLYDGTYTRQSAPVLLMPTTTAAPLSGFLADLNGKKRTTFPIYVASYLAKVVANIEEAQLDELKKWSDIILGIDFYISNQFYTFDESDDGTFVDIYNLAGNANDWTEMKQTLVAGYTDTAYHQYNGVHNLFDLATLSIPTASFGYYTLQLPYLDAEDVAKSIRECSVFRKYASLNMSDLTAGDINLKQYGLENTTNDIINTQVTLDDDYQSHDDIVPSSSIVYNKRLNISTIKRKLFDGFSARGMIQNLDRTQTRTKGQWQVQVKLDDGTVVSDTTEACPFCPYVYYPDVNASAMFFVNVANPAKYIKFNLKEHSGLNGAFSFQAFSEVEEVTGSRDYLCSGKPSLWTEQTNSLWLSEVSNPFHFDLNGMYTVGNGEVIALSSLVRPVSQGQFGEYPLIAFCTDGNYGLRVDDTGYYTNISPMQEDVALSQEQITNMESSILLITKKGIMETNGSTMSQLAAQMDGKTKAVIDAARIGEWKDLIEKAEDAEGFLSYLYEARMAYDYSSDRVVIYREDKTFAYVMQMEGQTVTKIVIGEGEAIKNHVIDYPDVLLQTDKAVYSLYEKDDYTMNEDTQKGYAITRPLALDAPLTLKVVERVKSLWTPSSKLSKVKYALFGSNDDITYHRCVSRFGRPFKYYKVALYTDMLPYDALTGTEISTSLRRNHKLR